MLTYDKISEKSAVRYLKNNKYDEIWETNDKNTSFFDKEVQLFGIYDGRQLSGLIVLENWQKFWEPHIFADKDKRGSALIRLIRKFLKNRIKLYGLLIGRVVISKKEVLKLSKWVGFLHFKTDEQYYYMGINNESIQF